MAHDDELNPQAIQSAMQSFDDSIAGIQGVGLGIKTLLQRAKDLKQKQDQDKQAQGQGDAQEEKSNITIQVGRNTVYKGPADGSGEFSLTPQQDEQVTKALSNPSDTTNAIKVLDADRKPTLQINRTGEVVKDDLGAIAQAESVKQVASQDVASQQVDFTKGQIPDDLGVPELKGVDPSKLDSFDKDLAISWGFELGLVKSVNTNRQVVGVEGTFPNEAEVLKSFQQTQESLIEQIKDKGYTHEQLLKVAGYTQSEGQPLKTVEEADVPNLDETIEPKAPQVQTELNSFEEKSPEQPDTVDQGVDWDYLAQQYGEMNASTETPVSVDEPYQSPVETVLDAIDNAPGLPPLDPAVQSTKVPDLSVAQAQVPEAPELSKDEQIEQLKAQLQENRQSFEELSKRIDTLTNRMVTLSPIKLANEQLNSWINKQRNNLASAIRTGAEKLAAGIERHDDSVAKLTADVKETVQKFKDGMERHDQAVQTATDKFAEVRDKVLQNYNSATQFVGDKVEQVQQTREQVVSSEQYQKGKEFFDSVAEPAVRAVISKMEEIGKIKPSADGTRTLDSETISWQVTKDDEVRMIDKSTGTQITPGNLNQQNLTTIKTFAVVAKQQGYVESKTQSQSQTIEKRTPVQAETQTKIKV